ncbi:MAG: peptidylprolyl isomerase [Flavobacteriales bacterium]|nr:peptidylprolyl isomerase [Flavobacteriales bacterium]MBL0034353.1 peptidylprolyl isomerase [Flavobacteriales bacterium]
MQRKFIMALFLGALVGTSAMGQGDDAVLLTVDGKPVTKSEFEAIYKKNNKDAPVTPEALNEYLDLFINYKLKVREAEVEGLDTVAKFKTELDGYRKQLARPYLIDRELNDQLMKEAYDRMGTEVRASHILVQVGPDASPEDTLVAFKKVSALRARVIGGEDFATVARSKGGSDDPSAAKNGGDLGWFSALQMVYPFETAAYNTKAGEVSAPVRTRFGYHIIKVVGKRPARGQIRVAHVMLRATENDTTGRSADAERRIREVHTQLLAKRITFADAALKYSEDESSSGKGGELPMFGTGKMIEEFEDASFALKADGDISEPFRTRFGWHIVQRLEYKAPPTFDEAKGELKSKIGRDSRADITRKAYLERLKKDYHFTPYTKDVKALYKMVDTTIFLKGTAITDTLIRKDVTEGIVMHKGMRYKREINGTLEAGKVVNVRSRKYDDMQKNPTDTVVIRDVNEGWAYDRAKAKVLAKPVFTMDGASFSQTDLLNYIESKQRRESTRPIGAYVDERFTQFVDDKVLEFEDANLEKKYPEFRMLMKEYRDGILLFELTDQKVWSKAVKDTVGLDNYYQANKTVYMYPTRYEADLYDCANTDVAKQVRSLVKKGKRGADLTDVVNKTSALNLTIDSGIFSEEDKPYLKGNVQPGLSTNYEVNGRVVIADLKSVVPPSPKPLNEARGLVTAAYQDQLEKDWIKELRAKYPVVVNKDVLQSIR